ncbi:MAG TPA: POTRA domain-containing protein [Thermoanaerobaculia bacterium]|jgi:hypothetical protein|nr:POTRA domain-containing protein [Thermoanaerobaculia bacterium]
MIRKLILLLLVTTPLFAEDPLYFIERIEVRNQKRVSPDVVIAESRLREGSEYSEADLRDAATRLGRLPFLLSVDFSLEKGAERGKHVLVLTVNETKPIFFLIDAVPYYEQNEPFIDVEYNDRSTGDDRNLVLGARWFLGRRGAAHIALEGVGNDRPVTREYAAFSIGYTQYDLFGTRAFATLNLKKPIEGRGEGLLSPQVVVGVPVSANQTITLQYDETRFGRETRRINGEDFDGHYSQRLFSARWSYNTTNEPFFPTSGTLVHVTPMVGTADGADVFYTFVCCEPPTFTAVAGPYHRDIRGVEAGATRYWELSERGSIFGDLRGEWTRVEQRTPVEGESYNETMHDIGLGVGYSWSLWSREERAGGGDSRLELVARFSSRDREPRDEFFQPQHDVRQVSAAWLRRTSWGTLRIGAGFAW